MRRDDPAYLAARRAIIRAHHPDTGGDPEVMTAMLAQLDRSCGIERAAGPGQFGDVKPSGARTVIRRRVVARVRSARAHLPRGMPGRKKYFDI